MKLNLSRRAEWKQRALSTIEFCYSTTNEFVEASILKKIWKNFKSALRTDHEIC